MGKITSFDDVDHFDFWRNTAYDEKGNNVWCEHCGEELYWDPDGCEWYCVSCGAVMEREDFLNYIGAEPPGMQCYCCNTNYPFCKKTCTLVDIDPDDPMLD